MTGRYRPRGGPRGRRPSSRPKGFEDVPELSPEEVERRVDVRGGGVPLAPAPVERPVRDLRRSVRRDRTGARDALLVLGLVVVGLVTVRLLLPDGPLTASETDSPSASAIAAGSVSPPTLGPTRTPSLQTLTPIATPSGVPGSVTPSVEPTAVPPTPVPQPTPTLRPGQTPRPTPVPTKTPTPTAGPTQPNRATVIVRMVVVNNSGGSAEPSDWTMKLTGEVGSNVIPNNFPGSESGTSVSIPSGKGYLVTDNLAVAGYAAPSASSDCKRDAGSGGLAPGTTVTCTITRNDKPRVRVIVDVVNDNGGTASAADWTVTVAGANATPSSFAGSESGRVVVVDPGAGYDVATDGPSGYSGSSTGDCSTSLGINDAQTTCTITFDDIEPGPTGPAPPQLPSAWLLPVWGAVGLGGRRWWTTLRNR